MNKLKAAFFGLIGLSTAIPTQAIELNWFISNGSVFEFQAPAGWIRINSSKYCQVGSLDGSVIITVAAYGNSDGNLQEFAKYRFSSVESFYKPTRQISKIENGLVMEYEGVWPNENKPTYYAVAAVSGEGAFFSMNIVTTRSDFEKNRQLYYSIFESVRLAHNK
jgi:hypothetical protein